eukprot:CAMPEP_0197601576 /NCGR_PEP_ID=MMETSP1326-20131121/35553_1 /TAXON_ID=1155430 /ORGANISM="Genus nov. species nov., Strain RCC2288" /LENGTH=73 /DNA_ID=CAMNT_0043168819 /DNA_START=178 /DNA_END=399 /DNA_ORIENTATION=-
MKIEPHVLVFGIVVLFTVQSIINRVILPWFDNLPWRKALREAAAKVTGEEEERKALEKATDAYLAKKEGKKKK